MRPERPADAGKGGQGHGAVAGEAGDDAGAGPGGGEDEEGEGDGKAVAGEDDVRQLVAMGFDRLVARGWLCSASLAAF